MVEDRSMPEGLLVPVIAPLDVEGHLDSGSFVRHVDRILAAEVSVHGLWINGSSGDFHALTESELNETVRLSARCANGRVPIIAHVGDTATARACTRADAALGAGADFIAAVTPYYVDYTDQELVRHYKQLAAVTGGPVMLYQHPATGKPSIDNDVILSMAESGVLMGIKESGNDLVAFEALVRESERRGGLLAAFHGSGPRALETLSMGASGFITVLANLLPATAARLHDAFRAGDLKAARCAQEQLSSLAGLIGHALSARSTAAPTIAAFKWLLCELGVFDSAAIPEPLEPLSATEIDALRSDVLPYISDTPLQKPVSPDP